MTERPNACENLNCKSLATQTLEACERELCCFAWQRRSREDRQHQEERDRREREGQVTPVPAPFFDGEG